jgi:nucleotidyltransferase/DNA polymerase involved in DNA repair
VHYILFLSLERFYSRTLLLQQPELANRPLVVHREKRVLDVDALAESLGIAPGMPLGEAKAIGRGGAFVAWEEEPYREEQERWLEVCAEFADVIEPVEQHEAFVDLSLHPEPLEVADVLASTIEQRLGYSCQFGVAPVKWIARVAAESPAGLSTTSFLDPLAFIAPLPVELLPVPAAQKQRLRFLGYTRIGVVREVPLDVLKAQFGEEGLTIWQAVRGGGHEQVQALYPRDALAERLELDPPAELLPPLHQALEKIGERLATELVERDLQGKEIELFLESEKGQVGVSRKFVKPAQGKPSLMPCLRLLLDDAISKVNVDEGVVIGGLRVRMRNLKKARRVQLDMSGGRSKSERRLSADAAFTHIRTTFGDAAITTGEEMHEPRRKRLLRVWKDATGWR